MENSSKALLIAAAVLIVILLVTISIKVLSPAEDVVEDANEIAGTVSSTSKGAVGKLQSALGIIKVPPQTGEEGTPPQTGEEGTPPRTEKEEILSKIQLGDKVAYDEGSGKTSTVDPSFKMDDLEWRVLSVESNGTVNLISTQQTTSELTLSGEDGWLNAETNLDKLCNDLYANGKSVKARSLKLEDIDKLAGINTDADKKVLDSSYGNLTRFKYDELIGYEPQITYSQSIDNGVTWSDYRIAGYSKFKKPGEPEINSTYNKNEDGTLIVKEFKHTYYNYGVNKLKQTTSDGIRMADLIGRGLNDANDGKNSKYAYYWLSSKVLHVGSDVKFSVRAVAAGGSLLYQVLLNSRGNLNEVSMYVRPVVSLPASLLVEKIDGEWKVNI